MRDRRMIKELLSSYAYSDDPHKIEETVRECRKIVRSCNESIRRRTGFVEFLSEVFRMNGMIILAGQIATLFVICMLIRTANDYPKMIPVFIPFFVLAALPVLFRAEIYRMGEIELSSRNSSAQLLLARLIIIGASDIVCFTLLLVAELFCFHTGQGIINLILYVFVPYMLCVTIMLRLTRSGRNGFIYSIGAAVITSVLWGIIAMIMPELYKTSTVGIWMICFIAFSIFFIQEMRYLIQIVKEGTIYGSVA